MTVWKLFCWDGRGMPVSAACGTWTYCMSGREPFGMLGSNSGTSAKMSLSRLRVGVRRADSPSRVRATGMAEGGGGA